MNPREMKTKMTLSDLWVHFGTNPDTVIFYYEVANQLMEKEFTIHLENTFYSFEHDQCMEFGKHFVINHWRYDHPDGRGILRLWVDLMNE